jgi:hypothetical protein
VTNSGYCSTRYAIGKLNSGQPGFEPMKKIPKANYQTAEELDARIKAREAEAASLPSGEARQSILKEVAQLRAYADVKRWLAVAPASGK